jgi:Flp pilus assembly protein TadD
LASMGRVEEAAQHFRKAIELQPDFAEAKRNLESAQGRHPPRAES